MNLLRNMVMVAKKLFNNSYAQSLISSKNLVALMPFSGIINHQRCILIEIYFISRFLTRKNRKSKFFVHQFHYIIRVATQANFTIELSG